MAQPPRTAPTHPGAPSNALIGSLGPLPVYIRGVKRSRTAARMGNISESADEANQEHFGSVPKAQGPQGPNGGPWCGVVGF